MSYLDMVKDQITAPLVPEAAKGVLDGVEVVAKDAASQHELTALRLELASALAAWAETEQDDLDGGETYTDRLNALLVSVIDSNKDGEISDKEADCLEIVYNIAAEWLAVKGVDESDISALLNDDDDEVAENVIDLVRGQLPDGEDAEQKEINDFAGLGSVADSAVMDATYKKAVAFRNGKKTIIKKRVSGKVRLTSAQKMAIAKAQRKANSGPARMKRLKSIAKRVKAGY